MNTFFDLLIDNFDVHLYIELSQLDEELMYFVLLGGVEPTKILEENGKKIAFVQKLFAVQQHTLVEPLPPPSHFLKILKALHLKILILSSLIKKYAQNHE